MNKTSLGMDTSNYTTSAAVYDGATAKNSKKLLPVASGRKGLRQSDAVFAHVRQIDQVLSPLLQQFPTIDFIGVSDRPRNAQDSYMPCFEVGVHVAQVLASAYGTPCFFFSHQQGHVAAALYSAGKLELRRAPFLAFHVSGGTTEALLVEPDPVDILKATCIAGSSDLKAGQAIDRAGVMMGLDFPCGAEMERLALSCEEEIKYRPSAQGKNISLSGIENKCKAFYEQGKNKAFIAKFCIHAVCASLDVMCGKLLTQYGNLPVLFSGGVSSSVFLRAHLSAKYGAFFAAPEFSSDNAAGAALLAYIKGNGI